VSQQVLVPEQVLVLVPEQVLVLMPAGVSPAVCRVVAGLENYFYFVVDVTSAAFA
jgi:hypothetical protein